MYSVLMTGYMFKNAQYRLELQQSLGQVVLPDAHDKQVFTLIICYFCKYFIIERDLIGCCRVSFRLSYFMLDELFCVCVCVVGVGVVCVYVWVV